MEIRLPSGPWSIHVVTSLLVFVPLPTSVYLLGPSLPLLRLSVHAGLPRVPGHLRHGDDQQGDAGEKEEDEPAAGASKRPGVVIFDPDGVLALNHALDGLSHHFQRDEGAEACRGDRGGVRQSRDDAAPDTPKNLNSPAKAKNMPAGFRR